MNILTILICFLNIGLVYSLELDQGDFQGFFTYDQTLSFMKEQSKLSSSVFYQVIGKSVQSRDIPVLSIKTDNDLNSILIATMLRPKEILGLQTTIGLIKELVSSKFESKVDIHFLPMINPDGYVESIRLNKTGEPLGLKNMSPSCSDPNNNGVNLGHNFAFGFNNYGSKEEENLYKDPCSLSYQGKSPFSEPETQAVKKFIDEIKPKLVLFLHQRAISSESRVIYPYTSDPNPLSKLSRSDVSVFKTIVDAMNSANSQKYTAGSAMEVTETTILGSEIDYIYDQQNAFALIVQLGTPSYFPYKNEIISLITPHIKAIMKVIPLVYDLPKKNGFPRGPAYPGLYFVPLLFGLVLLCLIASGFGIARYLGYDNIFGRFRNMYHRLPIWNVYRYTALKENESGDEFVLDDTENE